MCDTKEYPQFLYKYRPPCISKILQIIKDDTLWAADPNSFNDPFDCFPNVKIKELTHEEKIKIFLRNSRTDPTIIKNRKSKKTFLKMFEKEFSTDNKIKKFWKKKLKNII